MTKKAKSNPRATDGDCGFHLDDESELEYNIKELKWEVDDLKSDFMHQKGDLLIILDGVKRGIMEQSEDYDAISKRLAELEKMARAEAKGRDKE